MEDFSRDIRGLFRSVAETRIGWSLRQYAMARDALKESRFTEAQTRLAKVKNLGYSGFLEKNRPSAAVNTFFIMGSGSSANELSANQFDQIASQRSVGINTWAAHPFVCDIYSFESAPRVGDGRDLGRNLSYLNRNDLLQQDPSVVILRPKTPVEFTSLDLAPRELFHNIHFYGRVSPFTRCAENLSDDLEYFFESLALRYPGLLLDSGASVIRMISLAILLGYRQIVLVGVDLNGSPYFWESRPNLIDHLKKDRPVNNQQGKLHETLDSSTRAFGVLPMLKALRQFFRANFGGEIYVASGSSATSQFAPTYKW